MKRTSFRPLHPLRRTRPAAGSRQSDPALPLSMKTKTRSTLAALGAFWLTVAAASAAPAAAAPALGAAQNQDPLLLRGRYLVEHVGLCADCHSPRNEKGEFVRALWLKGAALPFQPTVPMPWSPVAPPIAGLPTMNLEQAVAFLRTGKRPDGTEPRPPMPQFRFSTDDAIAVAAYLKSLGK
ncbi:MAG: hypothetical protein B9S34_07925 [Opitutia bacterium Tous-C1TDCM]|nr:MAG: hypothetical protein B9S34_07925 [Opitutae bacterium Tous-C1TDCM]